MEFYCCTHLPDKVKELFLEEDDPSIVSQDFTMEYYEKIHKEIPDIIDEQCQLGRCIVVASDNVAILVNRKTAWLCSVDTKMRKGTSLKDLKKAYLDMFDLLRYNTVYEKIETRTPLEKFAKLFAKLTNSQIEGHLQKSFKLADGTMADEWIVGHVLERNASCQ